VGAFYRVLNHGQRQDARNWYGETMKQESFRRAANDTISHSISHSSHAGGAARFRGAFYDVASAW